MKSSNKKSNKSVFFKTNHMICIFDKLKSVKMRNIFSIILVCLFFFSCSSNQPENNVLTANTSTDFSVSGMMCEKGCKSYLTNQIQKFPGVVDCQINFSEKILTVDYNNSKISVDGIVEAVSGLMDGKYSIEKISIQQEGNQININGAKDNTISVVDFGFQLPNLTHLFSNWL